MTTSPFVPSILPPPGHHDVPFSEHLISALDSLAPRVTGSLGLVHRFIWFVPAVTLTALVWVINRSSRQTELFGMVCLSLQALGSVSSPFRIAVMLLMIAAVWFSGSLHPSRLAALIIFCGVCTVSVAEVLVLGRQGAVGSLAIVLPFAIATSASLAWMAREW